MSKNPDLKTKVMTLGDKFVGKTSMILRYCEDTFSDSNVSTIGIEFKIKHINVLGK